MAEKVYHLTTPIASESLSELHLDDIVYLQGTVLTVRDWSHQRIFELIENERKEEIPFKIENLAVFHCGPVISGMEDGNWQVVSIGPTSSSRFSPFIPTLLTHLQPRLMIGKGHLDESIIEDLVAEKCVFLQAVGGCAALYASQIKKVRNCYWPKFGMVDAVWELEVENFGPFSVETDLQGNTSYSRFKEKILFPNLEKAYDEAKLAKDDDFVWWPKVTAAGKDAFTYATKTGK